MKKCPQGHDNPDNANFCRICRYEFVEKNVEDKEKKKAKEKEKENGYTLDLFSNIEFLPRAVCHITFGNPNFIKTWLKIWGALFLGITIAIYTSVVVDISPVLYLLICCAVLLVPIAPVVFIKTIKTRRFRANADYVEASDFMAGLCRVAKKGKLGLFDTQHNKIVLAAKYDNLTQFDDDHVLVEQGGKKGLFSANLNRMIVPAKYDRIGSIVNSVVTVYDKGRMVHYDTHGNMLR